MELFWVHGYDQVSQRDMMAATGLSSSSLYNTYGTKAQLFDRVLQRYLQRAQELSLPLSRGSRGVGDIVAFLDRLRDQLDSPLGPSGCLFVTTMCTLAGRNPGALEVAAGYRRQLREGFTVALERARQRGEVMQEADLEGLGSLLVSAVVGIHATARAGGLIEARGQLAALREVVLGWG